MSVSIQITRTDANLVLINVKTVLPTLLSVDLYTKVISVYLAAYEKIKIIVKTKISETDSGGGVGISTKEGVLCPYN